MSDRPSKPMSVHSLLKEIGQKQNVEMGLEQSGLLATFSNVPPAERDSFILKLKARGFVNALWDETKQRIAVPVASYYPDHDIAVKAGRDLGI